MGAALTGGRLPRSPSSAAATANRSSNQPEQKRETPKERQRHPAGHPFSPALPLLQPHDVGEGNTAGRTASCLHQAVVAYDCIAQRHHGIVLEHDTEIPGILVPDHAAT